MPTKVKPEPIGDQLDGLFAKSKVLHEEWVKINVTPTGRLRHRLKPEQDVRNREILTESKALSKQICQLTNEAYDAISA